MLRLGTQRNRSIAEQQTRVLVFVGEVIVDRFRTLRATERVDEQIVLHVVSTPTTSVTTRSATRRSPSVPTRPLERDDAVVHRHRDVARDPVRDVQRAVANELAQLVVAQIVDVVDVFEVVRHMSPHRGHPARRARQGGAATERTDTTRRTRTRGCSSSRSSRRSCVSTLVPSLAVT